MDYKTIFSQDSHLEMGIGRVISLVHVNKVLFGIKTEFPFIGKIILLNANIINEIGNKHYININKLNDYIELIKNNGNIQYFPYNYLEFTDYYNNEHYKQLFQPIKEYLTYLDTIHDSFSNTIKSILLKNNILNVELVSEYDGLYCLKFDKIGKPLFLTLGNESMDTSYTLSYSSDSNEQQYEKLYKEHKNALLMENPEVFLITNLERVTGNLEFSQMIVKSYVEKEQFTTPILGITKLVLWKNEKCIMDYVEKFKEKYFYLIKDENTNFEGINKFLLNLEESDLQQWEVKEQINELYYNITHALINSFEILYYNK
jgi:hypothetical protein